MKKFISSIIIISLFTVNISASTSIRESFQMVYPISGMIPFVTSVTVYLLFTVIYLYIVIMYEVDKRKSLALATPLWLLTLALISLYFKSTIATEAAIIISIFSYAIIVIKSLYQRRS